MHLVDDSDIPLADRSNTLTKRRRTGKRSAVDEDISEVGSKPSIEEKSLDTESDDTNDFDDNHFSGGLEDEEVIEGKWLFHFNKKFTPNRIRVSFFFN